MAVRQLKSRWTAFLNTPGGQRIGKGVQLLFTLGAVAYLVLELSRVGWQDVWSARPTTPLFYLIYLLLYLSVPVADMLIYRIVWRYDLRSGFLAFLKKRIYNRELVDYSGEIYFYTWARQNIGVSDRQVFETVRDNNILSSIASTAVAVLLLLVFAHAGAIRITDWARLGEEYYLVGGLIVLALAGLAASRFRKYVFSMPAQTAAAISGVHVLRAFVTNFLQILQWAVVLPHVSLRVWFTYLALSIIISRIPLLPSRDLLFAGASTSLTVVMEVPAAAVASMMLMNGVLAKGIGFSAMAGMALARPAARSRDEVPAIPPPVAAVESV